MTCQLLGNIHACREFAWTIFHTSDWTVVKIILKTERVIRSNCSYIFSSIQNFTKHWSSREGKHFTRMQSRVEEMAEEYESQVRVVVVSHKSISSDHGDTVCSCMPISKFLVNTARWKFYTSWLIQDGSQVVDFKLSLGKICLYIICNLITTMIFQKI